MVAIPPLSTLPLAVAVGELLPLAGIVGVAIVVGALLGLGLDRSRSGGASGADRDELIGAAVAALRAERAEAGQAALDTAISVASSKLGDQLMVGKQVIDRERADVSRQVAEVTAELHRVSSLVNSLQVDRAEQQGALTKDLRHSIEATRSLAETTESLRLALASPKSRGQWGERMADDVLRAAGFVEGINYARERRLEAGTRPDYTFFLPQDQLVHMDVKFPIDNYLRYLDADTKDEADRAAKAFGRDVRQRIVELQDRSYIDPETTLDYLLVFIPNESVYGFLHEHDPQLIDHALANKAVLCSPTSLLAVLAVVRQSVDAFLVEQKSAEILTAIGGVRAQWEKFGESVDKAHRGVASAQAALEELRGPRSRQFERRLDQLESVRDQRLATQIDVDATTPAAPEGSGVAVTERGEPGADDRGAAQYPAAGQNPDGGRVFEGELDLKAGLGVSR